MATGLSDRDRERLERGREEAARKLAAERLRIEKIRTREARRQPRTVTGPDGTGQASR